MNYEWLGLQGKSVAVTGGASGIGRAISIEAAAAGAIVYVLGRDVDKLASVKEVVEAGGGIAHAFAVDVSDVHAITQISHEIGAVDVLVNSAGMSRPGSLVDISPEDWNAVIATNLTGYLNCAQAFGRPMIDAGNGSIVHIGSISAHHPQGHSGAYSVGKAGVLMLSKQLALEWGSLGVRSNAISPGMVRTPMTEAYYNVGDVAQRRDKAVPIGRVATPHDIAQAALFLASERSAYINGADLTVDGGFELTLMSTVPRPGYEGR